MNSRMDELQAAVLRAKLPHLDGWNRRRREIAARYAATIRASGHRPAAVRRGTRATWRTSTWCARERESLRAHLAAAGVATDVHYPVPDHRQPGAGDAPPEGLPTPSARARKS